MAPSLACGGTAARLGTLQTRAKRYVPARPRVLTKAKLDGHTARAAHTGAPGALLNGAPPLSPAAGTASGSTPASAADPASPPSAYPWLQQWYPVGVSADLPADRPHAFTLFGRQLVLWRDGGGAWRCFADACPHRLAPLSEGKVTGGQLLCSYHGWSFEGSGRCTRVPQAMDARNEAAACGNRRACAAAFPTAEAAGLVWVWPESSPAAADAAAAAGPPPVHPDLLAGGVGAVGGGGGAEEPRFVNIGGGWLVREVPYGWDTMVENIVDPGHINFAHHGLLGKREDAVPYGVKLLGEISLAGGFTSSVGATSRKLPVSDRTLEFRPPCFVRQKITPEKGGTLYTCGYSVPSRPGHCLLLTTSYADAAGAAQRRMLDLVPRWLLHLYTQEVLDGDLILLHGQERRLAQAGGDFRSAFFTPTPSDGGVVAFRRWLNDLAGGPGGLPWAGGGALPPEEPSHAVLLDRLRQHTQRCPSCAAALRRLRLARAGGLGLAAAAAAAAAWVPGADGGATALAALLGVAVAGAAHSMLPLFVYKDYVHAER